MTDDLQAVYAEAVDDLETTLLFDFDFDGAVIGKLCTGDVALVHKVYDFENVDNAIQQVWAKYIRSAVLAYLLLDESCRRFNVSSIVYSNEYSLLLASRLVGQKHNIPVCGTTAGAARGGQ